MFDPGLLADVAGVGEPVRLLGHRPVSADAGRRLERTIAFLQDNLLADPEAPGLPLMISTASRLLAAGVLSTFAHSASTARDGRHPRDRHPAPVRRAIAFMEDNAARPIKRDPLLLIDSCGEPPISVRQGNAFTPGCS